MSTITDMFKGQPKPKVEPIPTRDTAADAAANDPDAERRKRLAAGYGPGSYMLTGPSGVSGELTGTRSANG